jgi:hypothetical protein
MRAAFALTLTFAFGLAGCGGASSDPGLRALMRVANAQFVPGAWPDATDGPDLLSLVNPTNTVRSGQLVQPLSGLATRDTTAVALFLGGDSGYFIVEPGIEDPTNDNNLAWSAKASFSPMLPPGPFTIEARAVNAAGQFGAAQSAMLTAMNAAPPSGMLVITLQWVQQADLDLRVVDPDGVEIWAKNPNSHMPPAPGQPPDPNGWMMGGILDYDSNANCVIDGRRQEDVYWMVPPPSGHYVVRVDAFSMCGEIQANWTLSATLDGNDVGDASGTMRDNDTMFPHGPGAGVLALEFDVP